MWRLANKVYRAFRNTATHRCQQDVILPLPTACSADDEENNNRKKGTKSEIHAKYDLKEVLKHNTFSQPDLEKIQLCLRKFAIQQFVNKTVRQDIFDAPKSKEQSEPSVTPKPSESTSLGSFLQNDQACMKTLRDLSEIQEDVLSEIHLQMALDAFNANDYIKGVEYLGSSSQTGRNAAALYNLGLCYQEGLGVEQDRTKACECYRQASLLGHVDAQLNLTSLSNHIDLHEGDGDVEETKNESDNEPSLVTIQPSPRTPLTRRQFEWIHRSDIDLSSTDVSSSYDVYDSTNFLSRCTEVA